MSYNIISAIVIVMIIVVLYYYSTKETIIDRARGAAIGYSTSNSYLSIPHNVLYVESGHVPVPIESYIDKDGRTSSFNSRGEDLVCCKGESFIDTRECRSAVRGKPPLLRSYTLNEDSYQSVLCGEVCPRVGGLIDDNVLIPKARSILYDDGAMSLRDDPPSGHPAKTLNAVGYTYVDMQA